MWEEHVTRRIIKKKKKKKKGQFFRQRVGDVVGVGDVVRRPKLRTVRKGWRISHMLAVMCGTQVRQSS